MHNLVLIIIFVIRFEIFLINKEYWELRVQVQLAVELELPQYGVLTIYHIHSSFINIKIIKFNPPPLYIHPLHALSNPPPPAYFSLQLPEIDRNQDPMAWWREKIPHLNSLKPMILKYLCAPPSSVASERQFSTAGDIYTETRNRLLPENADRLIFITKNKKLLI